jgi:hypothetical protein
MDASRITRSTQTFACEPLGISMQLCSGQESNAISKQYIVEVDGKTQIVPMSQLSRACYQLTKASVKAWLNSVSRQQSLGIKGMTCVWLVRPELLTEMHIPDKLPKHIDQQLRKTAKRREQRQRAKQRAKEADTGMHNTRPDPAHPAAAATAQLSSLIPAQLYQKQASGLPQQGTSSCLAHSHKCRLCSDPVLLKWVFFSIRPN